MESMTDAISPEIEASARSTIGETLSWLNVYSSQIGEWLSNNK